MNVLFTCLCMCLCIIRDSIYGNNLIWMTKLCYNTITIYNEHIFVFSPRTIVAIDSALFSYDQRLVK